MKEVKDMQGREIMILRSSIASLKQYNQYLNLDWSKPHTDAEILAEIGLPEDFLEKEEC